MLRVLLLVTLLATANIVAAEDDCLRRALRQAAPDTTLAELRQQCAEQQPEIYGRRDSLVVERLQREREVSDNRSVLLPHQRNYFMPFTYAAQPNNAPFETQNDQGSALKNAEAQFQLSLKVPLARSLLRQGDALFAGFTARAFWQVYNHSISAPFRETNYEPELFWVTPVPWQILGSDAAALVLGLSHQSNGRSQPLSRSWNRLYANLVWERNRFVFSLKPWWRIPESDKEDPQDASGDDNPDIERYMGHFELGALYRRHDHEYGLLLRNNLRRGDNHGALQLEWTFPLHGRLRGYAQYFNGYGESLIDYDARIERIGFGILLSDLL